MKKSVIKILLLSLLIFLSTASAKAFWGELRHQNTRNGEYVTKEDTVLNQGRIGEWCYGGCRYFEQGQTWNVGDIVKDGNNTYRAVRIANHNIQPNTIPVSAGFAHYNIGNIWFENGTDNRFYAYNMYREGDVIYDNGKLYVFSGDYRQQTNYGRCSQPDRQHNPFYNGCWGKPRQTTDLNGKVYWVEATDDLPDDRKRIYYSDKVVYYEGDLVSIQTDAPAHRDSANYIDSANFSRTTNKLYRLRNDNNTHGTKGISGISPLSGSGHWEPVTTP